MPQHPPSIRTAWTWIALVLAVQGASAAAQDDRILADLARPEAAQTNAATVTAVADGLQVTTRADTDWPGMTITAPAPGWDLSAYRQVVAEVGNPGRDPLTVYLRVDEPGGDGSKHGLTRSATVAPGATGRIQVALGQAGEAWFRPIGMNRFPDAYRGDGDTRSDSLDPRRIVRCILFTTRQGQARTFTLRSLRGTGEAVADRTPARVPFIDRYGQFMHRDWPGKIHQDQDLATHRQEEAADLERHPGPTDRDRFGGWTGGPQLPATGFFRTARQGGRWWLVDPDGRLFWSHGICCVGATGDTPVDERRAWFADLPIDDPRFADCRGTATNVVHGYFQGRPAPATFDFLRANLHRKYGDREWAVAADRIAHLRLRSWGFTTFGNWSRDEACRPAKDQDGPRTPYTVPVHFWSPPIAGSEGYWSQFKDPFDPAFAKALRDAMASRAWAAGDPWCIGFFVDNELDFGDDVALARWALASPQSQPAKAAVIARLRLRHPAIGDLNQAWGTGFASWEALAAGRTPPSGAGAAADLADATGMITDAYYRACADAVHAAAPKQLYLGSRCNGWNRHVLAALAAHTDVATFNLYRESVDGFTPGPELGDHPILVGEYHWGSRERGLPRGALLETDTAEERAARFTGYVTGALANPAMVGCHWFAYADEPATGRSLDQENYAFGLVDVGDTPYPPMVEAARTLAPRMYPLRMGTAR